MLKTTATNKATATRGVRQLESAIFAIGIELQRCKPATAAVEADPDRSGRDPGAIRLPSPSLFNGAWWSTRACGIAKMHSSSGNDRAPRAAPFAAVAVSQAEIAASLTSDESAQPAAKRKNRPAGRISQALRDSQSVEQIRHHAKQSVAPWRRVET